MKTVISIILAILCIGTVIFLYKNIQEPIAFKEDRDIREKAVIEKLTQIRTTQELYRSLTDSFTADFDTLSHVLKNGSFVYEKIIGDADVEGVEVKKELITKPAIDSLNTLGINLDSLRYVPFSDKTFKAESRIIQDVYTKAIVPVIKVSVDYCDFMEKYCNEYSKYSMYDKNFRSDKTYYFGDLNAPTLNGNW